MTPGPTPDPPGRPQSLWAATSRRADFPALEHDRSTDVVVVGAGITGLLTATLLRQAGREVIVLDAGRVGSGATGLTTAKLSSLHGLTYADLARSHGDEGARAHGQANQAGLELIARLVADLDIDCDFRRRSNCTYAEQANDLDEVKAEAEVAERLGLPATFSAQVDLPFPVAGAVRFDDQAEFHPLRFLAGLARWLTDNGVEIFEHSRATNLDWGDPCVVHTKRGTVGAGHVIVATHIPFLDRGLYFARTHPQRSYAMAARIRGRVPEGMFLSTEDPAHTIRAHPLDDGEELLIVGGEGHRVGHGGDTAQRYHRIARWAEERFEIESFEYRWSTQDNMPVDGLPFIGDLWPLSDRVLTATGYKKWGLAQAGAAAELLRDSVLGRSNPWSDVYDPNRLNPRSSARELVTENAQTGAHFLLDRATRRSRASKPLAPGDGRVVSSRGRQVAVARDSQGTLHARSARCPHLGCIVAWNSAERTWDCPCHGSRFAVDGSVLNGPAVDPLAERELPSPPPRR